MKLYAILIFTCSIFLSFSSKNLEKNLNSTDLNSSTERNDLHPGFPDTLINVSSLDIRVFIKEKGKAPRGASINRDSAGNPRSLLKAGGSMIMDSLRFGRRIKDPVSLIIVAPGNFSTTLTRNQHFNPSNITVEVISDISIYVKVEYFFEKGFQVMDNEHPHSEDEKDAKWAHISGHICDPRQGPCGT